MNGLRQALKAVSVSLMAIWLSPNALAGDVVPGHTAVWYDPNRSGEGWVLEVLWDGRAAGYWFTFDESGNQRWLFGTGQVIQSPEGSRIDFPILYVTSGGQFGDGFDPDSVVLENAGRASFYFDDCVSGRVDIDALGYTDTVPMSRLTRTMGTGCGPLNGIPGEPAFAFAGETGSWYDPTHSGEGFPLQWLADGRLITYWFTYDDRGNQAWMFGVAEVRDGDTMEFQEVLKPEGARFGNAFDPDDVVLRPWGSMSMALSCESGTVSYASSLNQFGSGTQNIQKLTRVAQPACPYQKPKLADLYDVTWEEIPIGTDEMGFHEDIRAYSISDQGEVVAHKLIGPATSAVMLWQPGAEDWVRLGEMQASSGAAIFIAPDGTSVVTSERRNNDIIPEKPSKPVIWDESQGWQGLDNDVFTDGSMFGASEDRQVLVGTGDVGRGTGKFPWIWQAQTGVVELAETEELAFTTPFGVSNDGSVVAGHNRFIIEGTEILSAAAVRWVNGGEPELLYDNLGALLASVRACNADCSILAGIGQADFYPEHPHIGEGWIWQSGQTTYLGLLEDEPDELDRTGFAPRDLSADGSLIIGTYLQEVAPGLGEPLPFVWTQRTGNVSLTAILLEMNPEGFLIWDRVEPMSVSSTGEKILLRGESENAEGQKRRHAAVVTLTPKAED